MKISNLIHTLANRQRKKNTTVTTIVLHGTGGASGLSSINWLKKINLSYHYIIERDGTIHKCVPLSRVAFHAGKSVGPSGANCNEYSIGIAFANMENGEPLTQAQLQACRELIGAITASTSTIKHVTTHAAIAPKRKSDPRSFKKEMIKLPDDIAYW